MHDPGVAFQKPFSSGDPPIAGLDDLGTARTAGDASATTGDAQPTTLGRRVYRKGLQTFVWTARDPNKDALSFDVLYRSETDLSWNPLRTGIADSIFTWDTTSVPDGTYIVRIVASDAQSNTPGAALTGLAEGTPFDIDNSPPRITIDHAQKLDPFLVSMSFHASGNDFAMAEFDCGERTRKTIVHSGNLNGVRRQQDRRPKAERSVALASSSVEVSSLATRSLKSSDLV